VQTVLHGTNSITPCIKLQVVYLDFANFIGHDVNIDYRLPRMAHIKNEDFVKLELLDRKLQSRKGYGALHVSSVSHCFIKI
jgi:hypothetical protein